MKKTAILLLTIVLAGAGAGAGLMTRHADQVFADEPIPNSQVMLEQTAYDGNGEEIKVTVPVEFDGLTYILADYTRNIFVHDGTTLNSDFQLFNPQSLPKYTSTTGSFDDTMAVTVYYNLLKAYDFYSEETIGRPWAGGILGKDNDISGDWSKYTWEIPLYICTHVNDYADESMKYNAAFQYLPYHNLSLMLVGDGEENGYLHNQGKALDIIAHEYQHGISLTMNNGLGISSGAGALNEAVSDIFGMLIEGKDPDSEAFWAIGEDGVDPDRYGNMRYLRSIKNPRMNGSPSNAKYRYVCTLHDGQHTSDCDMDYVHYNSLIFSHFQYTAWELMPEYFTNEHIGHLWFEMLDLITRENAYIQYNNCYNLFAEKMQLAAKNVGFSKQAQEAVMYSLWVNGFTLDESLEENKMLMVKLQSDDGKFLGCSYIPKDETPTIEAPVKAPTDQFRYEFVEWESHFDDRGNQLVYTAKFEEVKRVKVQYLDTDGNLISSGYEDDESGVAPIMPDTAEFEYQPDWNETTDADGYVTKTAVYKKVKRKYKVILFTGETYTEHTLEYGENLPDPPKGYEGWYIDEICSVFAPDTVTGEMTVYAYYGADRGCGSIIGVNAAAVAAVIILGGASLVLIRKKKN